MSMPKTRVYSTSDAMNSEGKPVKEEKEADNTVDSIIRQAFGEDPFLSFSRSDENPVQLIHLLNALDHQGNIFFGSTKGNVFFGSSKVENCIQGVENSLELCNGTCSFLTEIDGEKELNHALDANVNSGKRVLRRPMVSLKNVCQVSQADLPGWPL